MEVLQELKELSSKNFEWGIFRILNDYLFKFKFVSNDAKLQYNVVAGKGVDNVPDMNRPFYIHCGSDGRFAVSEPNGKNVYVMNSDGSLAFTFGTGSVDNHLSEPHGVWMCDDGQLLIADCGNNRIQEFDSKQGKFVRTLCNVGGPVGLHLCQSDSGGNLYITADNDLYPYINICERTSGVITRQISLEGVTDLWPYDICVNSAGVMYVTDYYNNRVAILDASGFLIHYIELNKFCYPFGIILSLDESRLVVANKYHVHVLSVVDVYMSNEIDVVLSTHGSSDQFNDLGGICLTPTGDLLVADDGNNRVIRISVVD